MAIYHCSIKPVQRSKGQSATGKAAYRAGQKITDTRTGLVHDYKRKKGIDHTEIIGFKGERHELWNLAEKSEYRKDSTTAKEYEVALPCELKKEQQIALSQDYGKWLYQRHSCAVDICLHELNSDNPHAHILTSTRAVIDGNKLGNKIAREWSDAKRKKAGLVGRKADLQEAREKWEQLVNKHLNLANHKNIRIDHRTLEAQGIDRKPQIHLGPNVLKMEEQGITTDRGTKSLEIEKNNSQIIELREYGEAIEHERNIEIKKSSKHRRVSNRDRTISTSNGEPFRRAKTDNTRTTESSTKDRSGSNRTKKSNTNRKELSTNYELEKLLTDARSLRSNSADAADRIVNLSRPRNNTQNGGDMVNHAPKLDRTFLAVRRQLQAIGAKTYEIGIKNEKGMLKREWSLEQVLKAIPWLKRENSKGSDVYVRPAGESNIGVLLLDDLNQSKIEKMKSCGVEPAAVVETSPQNYQAWVKLTDQELPTEIATTASKGLSAYFGADPNSADWRHFGRLAGFTNRKPEHTTKTGRNPWVLAHESSGQQATRGIELAKKAKQATIERKQQQERETRLKAAVGSSSVCYGLLNPIGEYQNQLKRLMERYGANMDTSKADFMICKSMVKKGYISAQLQVAIEQASPELPSRKAGHEQDYIQRTIQAALRDPDVKEYLKAPKNLKQKGHGMGM